MLSHIAVIRCWCFLRSVEQWGLWKRGSGKCGTRMHGWKTRDPIL